MRIKKIQIIGLPGAGKSFAIKEYLKDRADNALSFLDISHFLGQDKERRFKIALKENTIDTIAESACGVYLKSTSVIKLDPPLDLIIENLNKRGEKFDPLYTFYQQQQSIRSNWTVQTQTDMVDLLKIIFKN